MSKMHPALKGFVSRFCQKRRFQKQNDNKRSESQLTICAIIFKLLVTIVPMAIALTFYLRTRVVRVLPAKTFQVGWFHKAQSQV